MSWDIFILDLPFDVKRVADIPKDYRPSPIKRSEIISGIIDAFPTANFSNPAWGLIVDDDWSIEVNLGGKEECESLMLHVRGGDSAIGAVATIVRRLKLRAIDCGKGEFFAEDEAINSFRAWRNYRDKVVKSIEPT